jgi:hypothetical protein
MEEDTRAFLLLIVNTIARVLLWMMVHVLIGIYLGYAFFDNQPNWQNIAYYGFFFLSLFWLLKYLKGNWKV